jgi:hypothetical protein
MNHKEPMKISTFTFDLFPEITRIGIPNNYLTTSSELGAKLARVYG